MRLETIIKHNIINSLDEAKRLIKNLHKLEVFDELNMYGQRFVCNKAIIFCDSMFDIDSLRRTVIDERIRYINLNPVMNEYKTLSIKDNSIYIFILRNEGLDLDKLSSLLKDEDNAFRNVYNLYYRNKIKPLKEIKTDLNKESTDIINKFTREFKKHKYFETQLQFVCDFFDQYGEDSINIIKNEFNSDLFRYYEIFGSDVCRKKCYREVRLLRLLKKYLLKGQIMDYLDRKVKTGEVMSYKELKAIVSDCYKILEIDLNAKASDVKEFYFTRPGKTKGNKENGLYIERKKYIKR